MNIKKDSKEKIISDTLCSTLRGTFDENKSKKLWEHYWDNVNTKLLNKVKKAKI